MTARFGDFYHVPHELQRLLRQVDAVLGVAVLEHTGQTGHRATDGHIPVGAPNDVLGLLTEAALLRSAVALIPDSGPAPDPASPLQGIGGGGELPPVDEHTHRRTGLAGPSGLCQPLGTPAGPGTLVLGVPVKGRGRAPAHAGILLGGGFILLRLGASARSVGRIGDDGIEGVGREAAQYLQGIALDQIPGRGDDRLIVHRNSSPSFWFAFLWRRSL